MKILRRILLFLHFFIGIGAVFGGSAAILNPENPLGIPSEALVNSPFSDYLVPGILLFAVLGLGNIVAGIMLLKNYKFHAYLSGTVSVALIIWLLVQCIMLRAVAVPHVIFFILGVIEGILAAVMLFDQNLFPADWIKKFLKTGKIIFL